MVHEGGGGGIHESEVGDAQRTLKFMGVVREKSAFEDSTARGHLREKIRKFVALVRKQDGAWIQ